MIFGDLPVQVLPVPRVAREDGKNNNIRRLCFIALGNCRCEIHRGEEQLKGDFARLVERRLRVCHWELWGPSVWWDDGRPSDVSKGKHKSLQEFRRV